MLEILQFIFSKWYIYVGVIILIAVIGGTIADIIKELNHKK